MIKKKCAQRLIGGALALAIGAGSLFMADDALAATTSLNESGILNTLAALEVMTGDTSGNLNLENDVTRAEFTKMVVTASTAGEGAAQKTFSPYSDVTNSHWAAGYIKTARDMGLINGYLDGTFRPNNSVTLVEAVTIALKNLGYADSDFTAGYPEAQMSLYYQLNLNDGISAATNDELSRRECAYLIYNMLNAKTKSGQVLAQQLGYELDAAGDIDYLSLLNDKMSGPYIVTSSDWQTTLGFTPTTCYRNDAKSTATAIKTNDVIYYSAGMKTVWAYSKQKSGTYESASPNRSNPTSITLSGVTYQVASSDAAYQLSSLGGYQLGEVITVLLGRDDAICGVLGAGAVTSTEASEVIGVITDSGTKSYNTSNGSSYSAEYIKLIGTDGTTYEFQYKGGSEGTIVKVVQSGSNITVKRASASLSGTVNSAATKLGNYALADDVEILDVYSYSDGANTTACAMTLHKSRLAGAKLSSSDVLYYEMDGDEISRLVLNNFSGDLYDYVWVTEVSESGTSGRYTYLSGGSEQQLNSSGTVYHIEKGAAGFLRVDNGIAKMINLSNTLLTSLDGNTASSSNTTWQIASGAEVYEYRGSDYYLTSTGEVSASSHTLRGYYDKLPSEGGRIRIIIAIPK